MLLRVMPGVAFIQSVLPLLIHSKVDEHLENFKFLVILNKVAVNICVQVFVWTYVFISVR